MEYKKSNISIFIKKKRKEYGYTQKEFSLRSGLGLRFVRELEQGKTTLRIDKVRQAVNFFGYDLTVERLEYKDE